MADAIISIDMIRAKAQAAFAAGQTLDQCILPPHSPAYATFAAEYTRLEIYANTASSVFDHIGIFNTPPSSHVAPSGRQRVDQAQGASC